MGLQMNIGFSDRLLKIYPQILACKIREIAEWLKIPAGKAGRGMIECRNGLNEALSALDP